MSVGASRPSLLVAISSRRSFYWPSPRHHSCPLLPFSTTAILHYRIASTFRAEHNSEILQGASLHLSLGARLLHAPHPPQH